MVLWSKIIDWIKLPASIVGIITAIVSFVILSISDQLAEKIFLLEFRKTNGTWISLCLIISISILLCYFLAMLKKLITSFFKKYSKKRRIHKQILSLSAKEKVIISAAMEDGTGAISLPMDNEIVCLLVTKGLIIRISAISKEFTNFAYRVSPYAFEYLKKRSKLLELQEGEEENINSALDIINWV